MLINGQQRYSPSRFSRNSEASASEFFENPEEIGWYKELYSPISNALTYTTENVEFFYEWIGAFMILNLFMN